MPLRRLCTEVEKAIELYDKAVADGASPATMKVLEADLKAARAKRDANKQPKKIVAEVEAALGKTGRTRRSMGVQAKLVDTRKVVAKVETQNVELEQQRDQPRQDFGECQAGPR